MKNSIVRIESVVIQNFKNVACGCLTFENTRKKYDASILGLYGQNGSGKTALIDAVALLKFALCGMQIPAEFGNFINVDAESSMLKFEFKVLNTMTGGIYKVFYEFSIHRTLDDSSKNVASPEAGFAKYKVVVSDEVLSCAYSCCDVTKRLEPVIDTRTKEIFVPRTGYNVLVGKNKSVATDLIVAKKLALATSRSFVFSRELLTEIRRNCKAEWQLFMLESLVSFGNFGLFIINTANSGRISMNVLPLAFKYEGKGIGAAGNLMIPFNGTAVVPQEAVDIVKKVISDMDIVLSKLIPGLTIHVKDLGSQVLSDNNMGSKIQLMSAKNGKEIPLRYESEGIKKIVSILQLLIVIYNEPSITVAIDELDSGVFEYLLGEILRIISEKGKGQLIFTSHNLRPLETLDRGFVAFTTTDPSNRYIRLSNVKANNNLRDFYYRDIVLGEQSKPVYEATDNHEIALAFREAGRPDGA